MTREDMEEVDDTRCPVCKKPLLLQMAEGKETRCPECLFPLLLGADAVLTPVPTLMPRRS